MNTWILFMWIVSPRGITSPSIATQEFGSKRDCLNSGIKLHEEVGEDLRFFCIEKLTKKAQEFKNEKPYKEKAKTKEKKHAAR